MLYFAASHQHNWSPFHWKAARTHMGFSGVSEVHLCCQLSDICFCFHHGYLLVLRYNTGNLPVSDARYSTQ